MTRADLHVHSTASAVSKLGVQRALGLPECATPPEEVYDLARRRGMDLVTITDHDTIDGALELHAAHPATTFVSEELTAWFRGEPQAVHVLCWGIDADDHEFLQFHKGDVERVSAYLHEHEIACALAHPFFNVEAPLLARHRRRLAELFPVWEVRNGSRAPELNAPAALYVETHGGIGVGGSDDHAGVDVGRTWTQTPHAPTPSEFLAHLREGRAHAGGAQGSAAKWAHAAMAIAVRTLGVEAGAAPPDPLAVLRMVQRVVAKGDAIGADLGPEDARALLRAWLDAVDLRLAGPELLRVLQGDGFHHSDLQRHARRIHERRLRDAAHELHRAVEAREVPPLHRLFEACLPAVPYAPAAAFLGREKGRLAHRDADRPRVALVADGLGAVHGVARAIEELRARGVPGFEVEVVGTDGAVDRRLGAVAEVDVPFYEGLTIGIPSVPGIVEALAEGRFDLVHVVSPGPAGVAAALVARTLELPLLGSYHTELGAYAALRGAGDGLALQVQAAVAAFYGACDHVLSPSAESDAALAALGLPAERVGRWDRGVDLARFDPALRDPASLPGAFTVLYAGRLTHEKGADLLAEAFLTAREREPRLHLCVAGGGPEEAGLRDRLGEHVTVLGWLEGAELARTYASADAFLFPSRTDTFGQVLLEAQASGLPVVAVDEGGPRSIVEDGVTGLLRPADPEALADALIDLVVDPDLRDRLAAAGRDAVADRTWDASLRRLADGYVAALEGRGAAREVVVAA